MPNSLWDEVRTRDTFPMGNERNTAIFDSESKYLCERSSTERYIAQMIVHIEAIKMRVFSCKTLIQKYPVLLS